MRKSSELVAGEDDKPSFLSTEGETAVDGSTGKGCDEQRSGEKARETQEIDSPLRATTTAASETWHEYIHGWQLALAVSCVTLVVFLVLLDTSIVATANPLITDEFHSLADIGWYASSYQLANAVVQPLTGKFYAFFKSKWVFMVFVFVFEVGSLLCGVAQSSKMLIVARAVAGLGASGLMNGAFTIIAGAVPLHKRAALVGAMMGVCQLGIVCGPLVGGALTQYTTWRWCFYINLPIGGAAAAFLLFLRIPEQVPKPEAKTVWPQLHKTLDLVGFALFAPAAIMLLLALQYGGNEFAWDSGTIIGLFVGSGATFVVWGLWNWYKGESALIPAPLLSQRAVYMSCVTQACFFACVFATSYYLPVYFQAVRNASPVLSGVYTLPGILSQLFTAVLSGVLVGRIGYVIPWIVGSGVITSIGTALFSTFGPHTPTGTWIGYQILTGAGRGMGMQMTLLAVQAAVKPEHISMATSLLSFAQYMGTAIFTVVAQLIFSEELKKQIPKYAPKANKEAIIASGATAFRKIVSPEDLPNVLKAYAKSIDSTFYLGTGLAGCMVFTAFGLGWVDISKKKASAKPAEP